MATSSFRPGKTDKRNFIGIELEAQCPAWFAAAEAYRAGNALRNAATAHTDDFKALVAAIKASRYPDIIQTQYATAYETTICCPEDEYKPVLKEMLDIRQKLGHKPTPATEGIHVHLDIRHRDVEKIVQCLKDHHREILAFRCEERVKAGKNGGYGNPSIGFLLNVRREGFETVEVRPLGSSFDFEHICKYVDFLIGLANSVAVKPVKTSIKKMVPEPELVAA